MRGWERELVKKRGGGRAFHVLPSPTDFEYHDFLVEWAERAEGEEAGGGAKAGADDEGSGRGKRDRKWDEREYWARGRFPNMKTKFAERGEGRHGVKRMEELGFDYEVWKREQGSNGHGKK